jgi:hypothetical protein
VDSPVGMCRLLSRRRRGGVSPSESRSFRRRRKPRETRAKNARREEEEERIFERERENGMNGRKGRKMV